MTMLSLLCCFIKMFTDYNEESAKFFSEIQNAALLLRLGILSRKKGANLFRVKV